MWSCVVACLRAGEAAACIKLSVCWHFRQLAPAGVSVRTDAHPGLAPRQEALPAFASAMHSSVLIPVCSRHDRSAASDSWRSWSSAYSRWARSFEAIRSGQSLLTIVFPTRRAGASGSHESFNFCVGFAATGALLEVFVAGRAVVVETAVDTLDWVATVGPADVDAELVGHVGSVGVAGRSGEQADTATIRAARPTNLSTVDCRTARVIGYGARDRSTVRGGAQRRADHRTHGALAAAWRSPSRCAGRDVASMFDQTRTLRLTYTRRAITHDENHVGKLWDRRSPYSEVQRSGW